MATAATICADLTDRIARYQDRYKERPKNLPITLDELAWLAEAWHGPLTRQTPTPMSFSGVPLRLVEEVFIGEGGSVVVRP